VTMTKHGLVGKPRRKAKRGSVRSPCWRPILSSMDGERLFSSRELCREAGITYRQLDYWCYIGLLEPQEQLGILDPAHPGSGVRRRFSRDQLQLAGIVGRLASQGVELSALAAAIRSGSARVWLRELAASADEAASEIGELVRRESSAVA
jgi:DNA-binding transcriptional MerR regulator